MSYYIGIDLGTSAVKLIMINEKAEIVKTVSKEYPLYFPGPNMSEQNPDDWWNAVKSGIEELTSESGKADVAAIGVAGQMHGLVLLDENCNPLRNAILWNDTRSGEETRFLNEEFGKEKLQELTGNIAFAGFTLPKLLWVKKHEKDIFDRCRKICLPKDYINLKLTGVFATDVSDASGTLYFDVKNRRWSSEMLSVAGIDESYLPKVYESSEVIGKAVSLIPQADVVAGAGDNAGAAIGTGTVNEGQCNISLGTSGTVFVPADSYAHTSNPALHSFCHANGRYHLMGCILSAASCNKWLNESVFKTCYNIDNIDIKTDSGLYFLPYLSGERCPHNDEDVKGAFIGITHATTREDMQKAVYEGISFAIRDCTELCPYGIKKATVCGGGTKSRIFMKILSNVLGIELDIISSEGPAYGAALLASGLKPACCVEDKIIPDNELSRIYNGKYFKFRQLYPLLKDFYKEDI